MKNVAYAVLLIASLALGAFGAFMAYRGIGLPPNPGAAMNDATFIGMASLGAAGLGIVFTCGHAITHTK